MPRNLLAYLHMSFGKIIGKDDKNKDEKTSSGSFLNQANANISSTSSSPGSNGKYEATLGPGSKVIGNLTFSGPVEIGGYVEGEIVAQDRIFISESAEINAKIIGVEVTIQGKVNGDIQASKRLVLKKPARIVGNISSSNLSIEEGVIFEGKCSMNSSAESASQPKSFSTSKLAGSI